MARATEAQHTDQIDWPNGLGCNPCTPEYATLKAERDAIYDPNDNMGGLAPSSFDDLSFEDYERWHQIDAKLCDLQNDGHLGCGVRF